MVPQMWPMALQSASRGAGLLGAARAEGTVLVSQTKRETQVQLRELSSQNPTWKCSKASLPTPLHPRQQGPRPQLLCPTPALDGLGCFPVHGAYIPGAGEGVDWLISPRG